MSIDIKTSRSSTSRHEEARFGVSEEPHGNALTPTPTQPHPPTHTNKIDHFLFPRGIITCCLGFKV